MFDLPRTVWIVAASRFFSSAASYLVLFLTLYLSGPRRLSATEAGLIAGLYGAGLLLGNLTGGRWGDRYGHRRVLAPLASVAGIGTASIPWLPLPVLVGLLPVLAYLSSTVAVSAAAISALATPRGDRRRSVAIGRAASNAGFVIGPPAAAALLAWNWEAVFVVDGAMTILVRVLVRAALPDTPRPGSRSQPAVPPAHVPSMWRALRGDHSLIVLLGAVVLTDLVYRQLFTTVPLRLRDADQPIALYTTLIALGSGLILLLEIPVTLRLRTRSPMPIIAGGYLLVGAGMSLFVLPVSIGSSLTAMIIVTAGEILYKTTATAHVLDAAPEHLTGQYQGLYTAAATSGSMLAAPVGTAVYATASVLLWPLCLLVCVTAAGTVLHQSRRTPTTSA